MLVAVDDVEVANRFFLVLTLAANAAVFGMIMLGLSARRLDRRLLAAVGPEALRLAWLVAVVATVGSLYYSEIADFTPCLLCWYQRICLYPLVAVLGVGALRRDLATRWYAAPFVVVGMVVALYHWLVERVPAFADSVSCSATAPCAIPWFVELGYVTLAYMDLSAFLLIGSLLVVDWRSHRAGASATP